MYFRLCCLNSVLIIMLLLIWTVVLLAVLTMWLNKTYSRFSSYGVKNRRVVPFFGNMTRVIFRMCHFGKSFEESYFSFPNEKFIGRYELVKPIVIVRDIDLIKKITIKDFEYFLDHRGFVDEKLEPLFARNLFSLKGEEWKDMRSTLSPAFTSSKIKLMVPFMEEVGDQMIRTLKKKIKHSDSVAIDVECKDLTTRYTNDVISSCAFGLKVDSHTDVDNQFYEMGKIASTFKFRQQILFFALSFCPGLVRRFKFTLFSEKTKDFFLNLVTYTMKDREQKKIIRPDMIHLLMEAKKGQLLHDENASNSTAQDTGFATVEESAVGKKCNTRVWSDYDLAAQAVLFLIAGFDTISVSMSFSLYELALHPDVQDRLAKEIKEEDARNGGKLNFNVIQSMTYMDMVTSEVLRLWPPGLFLDRLCTKDYNLGKPNDNATEDYTIRKGENLVIPVWCFHRDSQYFPDPKKFDPERFSEENKHKINPTAYMPFGLGPRNCIGSRFALCELKLFLYQIILHFEVTPSERTCIPAQLATDSLTPKLKSGHWLRFKIRS